jgi:CDP-diacylglycerol--serine O-phosphatidyltransferase
VIRLAKYNITPKEKMTDYFYGLPITMAGGVLASFILIYRRYTVKLPPPITFLLLVLLLAYLMVSKVKYINLDGLQQVLVKNKSLILWLILGLVAVVFIFFWATGVFLPEVSIFSLFIIYLLFSPFMLKLLNI